MIDRITLGKGMRHLIALLLATSAQAEGHTFYTWYPSGMVATETDDANCPIRIDIDNRPVDRHSRMVGVLGVSGIGVRVTYYLNAAAMMGERYDFEPPAGYIARPPSIDVLDGAQDHVMICEASEYLGF